MILHVVSPKMIITFAKSPFSTISPPPPHTLVINGLTTSTSSLSYNKSTNLHPKRRNSTCSCKVALKDEELSPSPSSSSSSGYSEEMENELEKAKIGARVRVKVPLKVYHVPRVAEVDLTGMEGVIKQYVAIWKGKHISANFPYKVEFFTDVQGRGSVKFSAHLRDDEFDYLD